MRYQRNIFLAGATALALVATAGFAAAQETPQSHKTKEPQASTQPMKSNPGTLGQTKPAGKMQMNAQGEPGKMGKKGAVAGGKANERVGQSTENSMTANTKGVNAKGMERAQNTQKVNRGRKTAKANMHRRGSYAERNRRHRGRYAEQNRHRGRYAERNRRGEHYAQRMNDNSGSAEKNRGLKGLQGNAAATSRVAGANVRLTQKQRTQIRTTIVDSRRAPRVGQVDFAVNVGTVVPRHIRVVSVPRVLVRIYPGWRRYEYFVYEDEVVIVNPNNYTIVAIVPA